MTHPVNRRQKPAWQKVRRPPTPPRQGGFLKRAPGRKISPPPEGNKRRGTVPSTRGQSLIKERGHVPLLSKRYMSPFPPAPS